jgi:hypothetical protein
MPSERVQLQVRTVVNSKKMRLTFAEGPAFRGRKGTQRWSKRAVATVFERANERARAREAEKGGWDPFSQ